MANKMLGGDAEQLLMVRLFSPEIRDDPEAFVSWVFPWGVAGGPLERFSGPKKWQRLILRQVSDFVKKNRDVKDFDFSGVFRKAVVSGRGIGKSALVSWLILWMLSTRIGSSVIVSANSEDQLENRTWGELTKWVGLSINSHWWDTAARSLKPSKWLSDLVHKDLKKGTRYWGAEGQLWNEDRPDAFAGVHNMDGLMVIFDEASGIPDSIWSISSGFFTESIPDRYFFAFSNGRRNSGYFYEAVQGSKRQFWDSEKIDARTVEDTDKSVYQAIIDEYGEDSDEARIEVYGDFPHFGEDQFISYSMVQDALARPEWGDYTAPVIMGIDPARGGSDSTVIVVRRGRDMIALTRSSGDDTMVTVGKIIEAIKMYKPDLAVIDEGGLGYGILDRLNELKYSVKGVNFGWASKNKIMWGNKRAEMWCMMRDWLKTGRILNDRFLKDDLSGPLKKYDSSGTLFLEGKKEMKSRGLSSPDAADALAVTFAFPINEVVRSRVKDSYTPAVQKSSFGGYADLNWMVR